MFNFFKFWIIYLLALEDLLQREEVEDDWDLIEKCWH